MRSKVKQARDRIEALRLALISPTPEEIGAVLPGLEEAVFCLETVERAVREGVCAPYEVRRELKMLKKELRVSARLVEHGVAFCQGWAKLLGAGPEYAQNGHTVPGQSEGTLSVRG
ncbi:MAG TPA: hypothetical protein VK752_18200 [Bryobacteraceae bacterium]|jgi:hypothetical protein|nr:hypothetical protein [Bryobacteraceae bacterium]